MYFLFNDHKIRSDYVLNIMRGVEVNEESE